MQKTFRRIYHYFDEKTEQENRKEAYKSLLMEFWSICLKDRTLKNWNPSDLTTIKFSLYKITDAPDFKAAKEFFKAEYTNEYGDIYFAGNKYDTIKELINTVKDYKYIAEFTVSA